MQITPNIHHFDTRPFNWYVIEESSRLTLVDAGFPGHYQTFLDGLKSIGRALKDVEAIILTHAHADHTGFAEKVRRATNAPVFIHQADAAKVQRVLQLPWVGLLSNAWRPYTATMLGTAVYNGVFTFPHVSKVFEFNDGDVLDVPGRPHVFHTPGHTPGEVAFYLPDREVLISGDTLVTQDLYTGRAIEPQVPRDWLNYDFKQAQNSLARLKDIGKTTILPGHGKPWTGEISAAIESALV